MTMNKRAHILVVDDSLINIFFIEKILKKNNYEVSSVTNGKAVFNFLKSHKPDLILLDIILPDIDGYEVCRRLKKSIDKDIPIIFETGKFDAEDIAKGYQVGGEDYIRKPILIEELLARVKVVLDKHFAVKKFQAINKSLEQMVSNRTKELNLLFKIVKLVPQKDTIDSFCQNLVTMIEENYGVGKFGVQLQYGSKKFYSTSYTPKTIILKKTLHLNSNKKVVFRISGDNYLESEERDLESFINLLNVEVKQILNYKEVIKKENEYKEFIRSILLGTPDAIVVLNNKKKIVQYNPAFIELFKVNKDEVENRNITHIFDPGSIKNMDNDIFSEIDKRGKVYFELENFSVGDDVVNCSVTGAPLMKDQIQDGYLLVCKDISKRIELEAQLMSTNKMEAIGQLAAGISHEINSPTQFIRNNVEFINESIQNLLTLTRKINQIFHNSNKNIADYKDEFISDIEELDLDFINEETQAAVDESLEGIDRITKIVNAMRTFSHPGIEEKSNVDINEIIKKAIVVSRNEWKYDATIETDFQLDKLVPLFSDKFSQVILNLIINAAHAIHDKKEQEDLGEIKIITRETENNQAEIIVKDNGKGIPDKIKNKIFEPFFTTKKVGKGTGQGLAMIYNIVVKNHDGTIDFTSEEGKGTQFFVKLPLNHKTAEDT